MKYSIIGRLNGIAEGSPEAQEVLDSVNALNPVWRLVPNYFADEEGNNTMSFEIWLDSEANKVSCYDQMKLYVDRFTGEASYHPCTHDEESPQPCVIYERYTI